MDFADAHIWNDLKHIHFLSVCGFPGIQIPIIVIKKLFSNSLQ